MTRKKHQSEKKIISRSPSYQSIFLVIALLTVTVYGYITSKAGSVQLRPLAQLTVPQRPSVYLPGPLVSDNVQKSVLGAETINPRDVITYVNEERMKRGARPLRVNETLMKAAQLRADVIMKYQNFSHHDPYENIQLDTVLPLLSYPFRYASENIGMGDYTARAFVNGFMNSPSHKANLLDPTLVETGVALASGPYKEYYVNIAVQLFAIPGESSQNEQYAGNEIQEYQQLLSDVAAQLQKTESLMENNSAKAEYYEDWYKLLIRQQEILMTVYLSLREKEPIVDSLVTMIEEYNANWGKVVPPES